MKRNLATIRKESDIFALLFLGNGDKISRCPLLNILSSGKNITVAIFDIADCQCHLDYGGKNTYH